MNRPVALIIRDGWGISPRAKSPDFKKDSCDPEIVEKEGNAPLLADIPFHEHLYAAYPSSILSASGEDVGLPDGQMGNSEVGHLNLGAGRIVYQDLVRVNRAIQDGSLFQNPVLLNLFKELREAGKKLHLTGLVSDGGVHSHQAHAVALAKMAHENDVKDIFIHLITDGRDTSPTGGIEFVRKLKSDLEKETNGAAKIVSLIGRYYAMDRDKRWERTKLAYDLFMRAEAESRASEPVAALQQSYDAGVTDEFIKPVSFLPQPQPVIEEGDGILFFNFRADRARQLSHAWLEKDFDGFDRGGYVPLRYATLTEYDVHFNELGARVVFDPETLKNILAEVVSRAGKTQFRLAETEKYPHVSYFFNGGKEEPYPGEDRQMVPSPKVATYDLQPEMSAPEVTDVMLERIKSGKYDLIILNYANPDMVGHTGSVPAAVKAVETVDAELKRVVETILEVGGCALITADHGNCEWMRTNEGKPQTAHTTNLVHLIYVGKDAQGVRLQNGILADIAPTLLDLLGLEQPPEMTGHSLIQRA